MICSLRIHIPQIVLFTLHDRSYKVHNVCDTVIRQESSRPSEDFWWKFIYFLQTIIYHEYIELLF